MTDKEIYSAASGAEAAARLLKATHAENKRLRSALEFAEKWIHEAWKLAEEENTTTALPAGHSELVAHIHSALMRTA